MYNAKSLKAEEFINDEEILDCLEYARKNKNNRDLIEGILEKAAEMKGISHRAVSYTHLPGNMYASDFK